MAVTETGRGHMTGYGSGKRDALAPVSASVAALCSTSGLSGRSVPPRLTEGTGQYDAVHAAQARHRAETAAGRLGSPCRGRIGSRSVNEILRKTISHSRRTRKQQRKFFRAGDDFVHSENRLTYSPSHQELSDTFSQPVDGVLTARVHVVLGTGSGHRYAYLPRRRFPPAMPRFAVVNLVAKIP